MAYPCTFFAERGAVWMTGKGGPFALSDPQINALLGLYDDLGDRYRFNELYDAFLLTGGVPCMTSMRGAAA